MITQTHKNHNRPWSMKTENSERETELKNKAQDGWGDQEEIRVWTWSLPAFFSGDILQLWGVNADLVILPDFSKIMVSSFLVNDMALCLEPFFAGHQMTNQSKHPQTRWVYFLHSLFFHLHFTVKTPGCRPERSCSSFKRNLHMYLLLLHAQALCSWPFPPPVTHIPSK